MNYLRINYKSIRSLRKNQSRFTQATDASYGVVATRIPFSERKSNTSLKYPAIKLILLSPKLQMVTVGNSIWYFNTTKQSNEIENHSEDQGRVVFNWLMYVFHCGKRLFEVNFILKVKCEIFPTCGSEIAP